MKIHSILAALPAAALFAVAPAHAASVLSGSPTIFRSPTSVATVPPGSLDATAPITLLNSVGFIKGSQVISDAINIPSAGTLTVKLAGISWLDALQNLNCFVSAPGGGILGSATNGGSETLDVQPGTLYVNWDAQASAPLYLGAYSISVNFQPATPPPPPVPLPPELLLIASGLVALVFLAGRRRSGPIPATAAAG
jgi:hypothetical protein